MTLSVAIVMATYNGERFLPAQLASFAAQRTLPTTLIASDDGSTDDTLGVLERFKATAPFPVVVRSNPQRLGYGSNFLAACELATADLIAFSDQDDVWQPEKLARTVESFASARTMLSVHTAGLIDGEGRALGHYSQKISKTELLPPLGLEPWGFYSGFTMTVRRSLLELIPSGRRGLDVNQVDQLMAHDRWVHFLANCAGDTALLDEPLALYRQHGKNLFGKPRSLPRYVTSVVRNHHAMLTRTQHFRAIAEHHVALLRELAVTREAEAATWERAAACWEEVAESERKRERLYGARPLTERVGQLLQNLGDDTYKNRTDGSWRKRAVARDVLGALLPPAP